MLFRSHVRHADRARRAGYAPVEISAELGRRLSALAAARGMTLFSLLLTGWALLLGRLSRQDDVVIGTPSAGRTAPGSETLIGFFVNTLALRVDLSGYPNRDALLARAHAAVSAGLEHEQAPFEQVKIGQPKVDYLGDIQVDDSGNAILYTSTVDFKGRPVYHARGEPV